MKSSAVCARIREVGVVPVVRVKTPELALRAADALFRGGIPVFEITLTVPEALGVIRTLRERFGDQAVVGAGTVLSAADAAACIDAGAEFIVSPNVDAEMIEATVARGAAAIAGALTPSEIVLAWRAGANMVKVFPCSAVGGPAYLRALRGPLPHVLFLPTGGISLDTARAYVEAGAAALGVGSELVDGGQLARGGDSALRARAQAFSLKLQEARAATARDEALAS